MVTTMIPLQFIVVLAWSLTTFAWNTQYREAIAVTFEGQKSGTTVRFNCSLQRAPPSKTIEFLVNSITANNIRLYQGECYLTHKGNPCNLSECQCSKDGKRFFWAYEEAKESFTATCKARINNGCNINATIQFTDRSLNPHNTIAATCGITSDTMCCAKNLNIVAFLLQVQLYFYCFVWYYRSFSIMDESEN